MAQRERIRLRERGEIGTLEEPCRATVDLPGAEAARAKGRPELVHGGARDELMLRVLEDVRAATQTLDPASARIERTGQHEAEGALAGSVRADDREQLATTYRERRPVERRDLRSRVPVCDACRSEEHTSELQSPDHLVCRLLL